jgi:hypothetical protein
MQTFHSVFDEVHDVAVFGGGYAGFAAARALVEAGKKVLLIDRRAALLSESGWSFQSTAGTINGIEWRDWWNELQECGAAEAGSEEGEKGRQQGHIDGAIAEVIATQWVQHARRAGKLKVLYYAAPLALEGGDTRKGELLDAVLLGTKGGLRRVAAMQWIDATEGGELLQLLARVQETAWQTPPRLMRMVNLYFRHAAWPDVPLGPLENQALSGARLKWGSSLWPNERCLTITVTGEGQEFGHNLRGVWIPALKTLHENFPDAMREAVLTHGSVEPFDVYSRVPQGQSVPPNVATAVPWQRRVTADNFLAGRFEIGSMAARRILDLPQAEPQEKTPFKGEIFWREEQADVAIAGLGTGGALATLAAARSAESQKVLGFDPLSFCGGIGAGGGIHWYYYGVKGGLQDDLDARQREVMPLFASSGQIQGFHPDAKKCVLETMLRESGAHLLFGAMLLDVERDGSHVKSALLSTPDGPLRLLAPAWIDSTGDGDLAARAGAPARFGRDGDGLLHAYSQSSGKASLKNEKAFMNVVNYDAGFVDPTDSEDLTRARLEGIEHYAKDSYSAGERPTYIAPAIGLRQSRHIVTDYTLELSDLIERREFADSVGLTGCHYDNHAVDYEFESDESLLWVWVCRQWRGRIACEIPYRILLPQGLENVWLACRALGVSQDAHHSLRMQRDMQRIGEVAGLAAILAPQGQSRQVPFEKLREALQSSGAVPEMQTEAPPDDTFGPDTKSSSVLAHDETNLTAWLEALENAPASESFDAPWHLYRAGKEDLQIRTRVLSLLESTNDLASWRAAAIAALWGESVAAPRLVKAIQERADATENTDGDHDKTYRCEVPNWLIAVSLLRLVGAPDSLAVLNHLADDAGLLHNARTAIALCCEGIASRHELSESDHETILEILWKLIESPAPNSLAPPQRPLMQSDFNETRVLEDWSWQIHLAVARARRSLGLPPHEQAVACLGDERALVRRAFQMVCVDVTLDVGL